MKQSHQDQDYQRSKFLISAMIAQIVAVLIAMFAYFAFLSM